MPKQGRILDKTTREAIDAYFSELMPSSQDLGVADEKNSKKKTATKH